MTLAGGTCGLAGRTPFLQTKSPVFLIKALHPIHTPLSLVQRKPIQTHETTSTPLVIAFAHGASTLARLWVTNFRLGLRETCCIPNNTHGFPMIFGSWNGYESSHWIPQKSNGMFYSIHFTRFASDAPSLIHDIRFGSLEHPFLSVYTLYFVGYMWISLLVKYPWFVR